MIGRAVHISDLHRGKRESVDVDDALARAVAELRPEVVIATGDLANRGRRRELESARSFLDRLDVPVVAVPGNHDLPYTLPARLTTPWREFERAFDTTDPVLRTESVVVCGLNSACAWRHQGGRLSRQRLTRIAHVLADAAPGALRVVALHHHLAGAPWRTSRKFPLSRREHVLEVLVSSGVEVVLSGHIHQASAVARCDFRVDEHPSAQPVLVTAPGAGRPRPGRAGETHGFHVLEWDEGSVTLETRVWSREGFTRTARRVFARGAAL
jgi:3',5'-cyclic AMP phosphodiesterase CpdA